MAFTIRENLSLILSELEWVGTSYDINIENGFAETCFHDDDAMTS